MPLRPHATASSIACATRRSTSARETVDVALTSIRTARRAGRDGAVTLTAVGVDGRPDAIDLVASTRIREGLLLDHRIVLELRAWSRDNYVVLPGACYAGNRFPSRRAASLPNHNATALGR